MLDFEAFFRTATGHEPYAYQARIAREGLPEAILAPTGTGKTGVLLAWLWRRLSARHRAGTPRRLIYALPRRGLADQVAGEARGWLEKLGLADEVALQVALGARGESTGDWRENMHQAAIVVGPVDSLVSKALNRGYGIGRVIYPIDFALVTNGAQWIVDEARLCPESTSTLRQLAAFAGRFPTAEPFGLTCMSAAIGDKPRLPAGNPPIRKKPEIPDSERTGPLALRLAAARTVRRLRAASGDYRAISAAVAERHRAGASTLVVLNTVDGARTVYEHLRAGSADCTLLHTRFRGIDRARVMADVIGRRDNRIVVAAEVVEAGLELDAAVLVTEAAPWPALVRRAGRCNRGGTVADAELWWTAPAEAFPYPRQDIDATAAQLELLEGTAVSSSELFDLQVGVTTARVAVLRDADLARLFDTARELGGGDVDIAPYVRDAEPLEAEVAWATWTPGESGAPRPEVRAPAVEYRCRVPLAEVAMLARDRPVWRLDQASLAWTELTGAGQPPAQPGELLLVNAAAGGYSAETGFDLSARGPVAGCPALWTADELADIAAGVVPGAAAGVVPDAAAGVVPDAAAGVAADAAADIAADVEQRRWMTVDEHSQQVRDQVGALLAALAPSLPPGAARSAVVAGYLHDAGKAHRIWQNALCALATPEEAADIAAGRPWAKSGGKGGALEFEGGVGFRHELASLLLVDGPLRELLAEAPDQDLTRYLVLAHHGKLRVQVRDPGDPGALGSLGGPGGPAVILGLEQGAVSDIPAMLGQPASTLTVDLDQFGWGGDRSWTQTVVDLRERYGPFVLAYLEALVRIADWRASGGRELPPPVLRE